MTQTDLLAVSAAIAKAEKIIAYNIDDATYNKASFQTIPFVVIAWTYLIELSRDNVKEDKETTTKALASINEAYDKEKHTKTSQDIEITINADSTEEDKARALLKVYLIEARTDLALSTITEIYLLGSTEGISTDKINEVKTNVNQRYQKEIILTHLDEYIDKAEKIIGYNLKNNLSTDTWEYIHRFIIEAWYLSKEQSLGWRDMKYRELSNHLRAITDEYNPKKHTTPLERVEITVNEHSNETDKARFLVKHYMLHHDPLFAKEMSETLYRLLKTKETITSIEELENITDYINYRYQNEFEE